MESAKIAGLWGRSLGQISGAGLWRGGEPSKLCHFPAPYTNSTPASTVRVNAKQGESADAIDVVEGDRF